MYIATTKDNISTYWGMFGIQWGLDKINKRPVKPNPILNTGMLFTAYENLNVLHLHHPSAAVVWQCQGTPATSDGLLSGCFELMSIHTVTAPSWTGANKKRVLFRFALEAAAALQPLHAWDIARQALDNARDFYNNPSSTVLQKHLITGLSATLNKPAFGHVPLPQIAVGVAARAAMSCGSDSGDSALYIHQAAGCLHHIGYRRYGVHTSVGTAIDSAVAAVAENSDFTATY
ncbi:MAG: hypothetical protein A2X82_06950 [Geobacteraceae bacterium GWC2_55_20]|nr:MAG: hypothetical protein A2X82_06950 [Geobacteraceae bacterium GWC2_55_20]HCE68368.1 hypothetical protein [Geobacter sp.]